MLDFRHGVHTIALKALRATISELARGRGAVNPEAVIPVTCFLYFPSSAADLHAHRTAFAKQCRSPWLPCSALRWPCDL